MKYSWYWFVVLACLSLFRCGYGPATNHLVKSQEIPSGDDKKFLKNGADIILCATTYETLGGKTAAVVDIARVRQQNIAVDLGDQTLSEIEKVALVVERLKKVDPDRAARYSTYLSTFFAETSIIDNVRLPEAQPDDIIELPGADCEVKQISYQRSGDAVVNNKRYFIKKPMWDVLDTSNRAALILNELVYRDVSEQFDTPRNVSSFLQNLFSNGFKGYNYSTYAAYLKNIVGMPATYRFHSSEFDLESISFYASGAFKSGIAAEFDENIGLNILSGSDITITYGENGQLIKAVGDFMFGFEDGSAPLAYEDCGIDADYMALTLSEINYDQGNLVSITPEESDSGLRLNSCTVNDIAAKGPIPVKGKLLFHPNGRLKQIKLSEDFDFIGANGAVVSIRSGKTAKFNDDGSLKI